MLKKNDLTEELPDYSNIDDIIFMLNLATKTIIQVGARQIPGFIHLLPLWNQRQDRVCVCV